MSIERRLSDAVEGVRANGVSLEGWNIHMGLGAYRQFKREVDDVTQVAGVPVRISLCLAEGEIILRYEVKA